MLIRCPNCDAECETEVELAPGQHVLCPFCNVKFSYCAVSPTGERLEPGNQIIVKCPGCGTEYEVDASNIGQEIECEVCGRKFVIEAQEKNVEEKSPPIVTSKISVFGNESKSNADKHRRPKPDTSGCSIGCLAIVLPIIALFIIAGMHNWMSVLLAVVIGFFCIMICVYHKLNKQLDGGATLSDAFKRLGVGGSSISVVALTLACVFLMHSCDRQAKEDDFRREERSKKWKAQIERDGGWMITLTCPDCNFGFPYWIDKDNRPLYGSNVRCPNCGKYRTKCRW